MTPEEKDQTQNLPEADSTSDGSDIADLFEGGGEEPEPGPEKPDGVQEVRYKVRGEERVLQLNPKDPESIERVKKALEKSDGAEIRDAEKNRRIADLERELAETKSKRQQEAEEAEEQKFILKKVPPIEEYIQRYEDEERAKHERNRDIEIVKLNFGIEQDRRRREAQEKAAASDKQLEQAKANAKEKYGFTSDEIEHAIMQAPINGCTTLMAALRFEYPERFVPGAVRPAKSVEEEKNVSGSDKVGTISGSRAPAQNESSEDFKVASRLCKGASQKDLEKAATLINRNSSRYQKIKGRLKRR